MFEEATSAQFNLLSSGPAMPVDGKKGAGTDSPEIAIIEFSEPVVRFGGYWGSATDPVIADPALINFEFLDSVGNVLDSDFISYSRSSTVDIDQGIFEADGMLLWAGWQFNIPVSKIQISGSAVANDFLQAIPVPELNTAIILLVGCLFIQDNLSRIR